MLDTVRLYDLDQMRKATPIDLRELAYMLLEIDAQPKRLDLPDTLP